MANNEETEAGERNWWLRALVFLRSQFDFQDPHGSFLFPPWFKLKLVRWFITMLLSANVYYYLLYWDKGYSFFFKLKVDFFFMHCILIMGASTIFTIFLPSESALFWSFMFGSSLDLWGSQPLVPGSPGSARVGLPLMARVSS